MQKAECEKAIRQLCSEWSRESGARPGSMQMPSFTDFKSWLHEKGYGHYLKFRSVGGPDYIAELWFDEEFKQSWRN